MIKPNNPHLAGGEKEEGKRASGQESKRAREDVRT